MNATATGRPSEGFGTLFAVSAKAIGNLLLQYAFGVAVAMAGLVKDADVRSLSTVMNWILIPSLTFVSLGKGLSLELMATDAGCSPSSAC